RPAKSVVWAQALAGRSGQSAVSAAAADHAAAADNTPINDRAAERARKPNASSRALETSSTIELTADLPIGSAQNIKIDPLGELGWVGAPLDHVHRLEFLGVQEKLLLEQGSDGMVVVGVAAIHSGEILHRSSAAVSRIDRSGVGGIARDSICRLQYRTCQSGCHRQFASD